MNINQYIIYFIIGSFIGYLYETIAMSFWGGKFENRGFLLGPIIPIYGVGFLISEIVFWELFKGCSVLTVFLIGCVGSFVLEYPTHLFLENTFHQKWWDYSSAPFNIQGRVCLPATIGFGIGAIIIVFFLNPIIIPMIKTIPNNIANGIALLLTALFVADLTLTLSIISDFEEHVSMMEENLNQRIGNVINNVLDEDKPLRNKANVAFDKMNNVSDVVKERVLEIKEKGGYFKKGYQNFKHKNIERILKYRKERKKLFSFNRDKK